MRRKTVSLLLVGVFLLGLCGCAGRSLGERAIVKMIYLDEAQGQVEAALVVFTCAPNSDTASVEGEAKIYTAQGRSIEEALYNAEQEQNKKVFYAQNELLLLGPGAAENVTHYLAHFAAENAARPNLSVFLTPMRTDAFCACEDVIGNVVREGERLIGPGAGGENRTQSIFELDLTGQAGMNGYLPVFEFSEEEKEFCGVREIVLIRDGQPDGSLRETPMHLALLLAGKARRLTVNTELDGKTVSFQTQRLSVTRTPSVRGGKPHLLLQLTGKLDGIAIDGIPAQREAQAAAAGRINDCLEEIFAALDRQTFQAGNDVFHHAWWLCQEDAAVVRSLRAAGLLYDVVQIEFESRLEPA